MFVQLRLTVANLEGLNRHLTSRYSRPKSSAESCGPNGVTKVKQERE